MITALLLALATVAQPARASQSSGWNYPLAAVQATGLKRIPLGELQALSGLRVGQTVRSADVEAAHQRLLKSGLFTSVGYDFPSAGYGLVVAFNVIERAWDTRVVFDNFVDHTDAQLISAIARDLPTFDGFTPDHDAVLTRIKAALERVARESTDPGKVSHATSFAGPELVGQYRFRLDRMSGPLPMCAVDVTGIGPELLESLREKARGLLNMDYSRGVVSGYAQTSFIPTLAEQGLPRARVAGVTVRREASRPGCERGVAVSVSIDPGKQ